MTSSVATLTSGLVGLAGTGGAAAVALALARRGRSYLPGGHAVPARDERDPLRAALRSGFAGVTVAVRPGPRGELYLGHGVPEPGRTLRRLVLRPLGNRIAAGAGAVYPGQRAPFALAVEFVGPDRDAQTLLRAYRSLTGQLRDHADILTGFSAGRVTPGPVLVTLCGIVDVRELLAAESQRYAFADGSFDDVGSDAAPVSLVPTVSEHWSWRFGWDGREPICAEERHLLHALVREAHADGRAVRLGGVPAGSRRLRTAFWTELTAAGVDAIADPDLRGLARFLRARRGDRQPLAGRPDGTWAKLDR